MSSIKNSIFVFDQFNQKSSEKFVKEMMALAEEGVKDVTIYINSYGGSVYSVNAVLDTMDKVRKDNGVKIKTIALGLAASGGAYLLIYGDDRYASKNTSIQTHGVQAALFGSEKEIKEQIKEVEAINQRFARLVSQRSKMTYEEAYKFLSEDVSMTAEEATKKGLMEQIWDAEAEIQQLIEEASKVASIESDNMKVQEVNDFLLSLKITEAKMNGDKDKAALDVNAKKSDDIETKELKVDFNTLKVEHDNLKVKFQEKVSELENLKKAMKENVVAKVMKVVSEDKKAEVKAELESEDIMKLEFPRFESYAERLCKFYSTSAHVGVILSGKAEGSEKKTEMEKKIDAEFEAIEKEEKASSSMLKASYGIKD